MTLKLPSDSTPSLTVALVVPPPATAKPATAKPEPDKKIEFKDGSDGSVTKTSDQGSKPAPEKPAAKGVSVGGKNAASFSAPLSDAETKKIADFFKVKVHTPPTAAEKNQLAQELLVMKTAMFLAGALAPQDMNQKISKTFIDAYNAYSGRQDFRALLTLFTESMMEDATRPKSSLQELLKNLMKDKKFDNLGDKRKLFERIQMLEQCRALSR